MKTEDAIYLAGFIDGEGCIGINKIHRTLDSACRPGYFAYELALTVGNTDESIIYWIQEVVGKGHILSSQRKANCKECFTWTVNSRQALSTLEELVPYLKVKRKVAELCIEFQRLKQEQNRERMRGSRKDGYKVTSDEALQRREWFYQQAKGFNRRGP